GVAKAAVLGRCLLEHGRSFRRLRLAREAPLELVQVVVVVPRDEADEVPDRHPPAGGMDAAPIQVLGAEAVEELHGLVAPRAKVLKGLARVVALLLPLDGPAVGLGGAKA